MTERFDRVYRENLWNGRETYSGGPGSGDDKVRDMVPIIHRLVKTQGIGSVLDVGCGDGYWIPPLPDYIGLDVSSEAIAMARRRHPERDFRVYGGGPLPPADLVLCIHVLQHMTVQQGVQMVGRIRKTGARWLMATTFSEGENFDRPESGDAGGYWPDLTSAPFDLGEPMSSDVAGHTRGQDPLHGGMLGIWRLA